LPSHTKSLDLRLVV